MKPIKRIVGVLLFIIWVVLLSITMIIWLVFVTPAVWIFRGADAVSRIWNYKPPWLEFIDLAERWSKS